MNKKEYNKAYRETNKERLKAQREANKEKRQAWIEAHKEELKAYGKAYREANKDKCRECTNTWRKNNPLKVNAHNKKHRHNQQKKYRTFINRIKAINGCQNPGCKWVGEFDPCSLDFHHINESEKRFNLGSQYHSKAATIQELKKCCVLCANCHRQIRWGKLDASLFPRCKIQTERDR